MRKKRIRFDYKNATLEDLRAYKQKLFESNRKLFGATPRARYQEVTERFGIPNTMGATFSNADLEKAELKKQISIMTGGYEYHRAGVARENLAEMIRKLSFKDSNGDYVNQGMIDFIKTLSLNDMMRHSEEYNYIFRLLEGYSEAMDEDSSNEDILEDIADSLRDEIYKSPKLTDEYEEYVESLEDVSDAMTFEDFVWEKWGLR